MGFGHQVVALLVSPGLGLLLSICTASRGMSWTLLAFHASPGAILLLFSHSVLSTYGVRPVLDDERIKTDKIQLLTSRNSRCDTKQVVPIP